MSPIRHPHPPVLSPEDLRDLSIEDLRTLAVDIRQAILTVCMRNGGHLGASLGAVELALALHYVFESPREPLVWDVGHQAYAHKLLTGRWNAMETLRLEGGISGFPKREESPHDAFGVGHSSTALSAAVAMAWARGRESASQAWTVAIVGDGSLTSGMCYEALQTVKETELGPFLVVINDNHMSISPSSGSLPSVLFNWAEFDYVGPIDGHDLDMLVGTLRGIRENYSGKPVLLHVMTEKGKGYAPAEHLPSYFHGISPLKKTVVTEKTPGAKAPVPRRTFSEQFGETLCRLAAEDPRIVAVTAAMKEGTGLGEFARLFPDRFFDVGIAEPHAVTFAAGLATQGYRPVVAIYSTFLQRAYDSLIHDVALQKLGVTFAIDRAGVVGADGPTHHGAFDLAYLRTVPGLRISVPATLADLEPLLREALRSGLPSAIRYPRGEGCAALADLAASSTEARWLRTPPAPKLIALGLGPAVGFLWAAAKMSDPEETQIAVLGVLQAKPLPLSILEYLKRHPDAVWITAESGAIAGGFGEALLAAGVPPRRFHLAGYGDHFIPQGTPESLERQEGLSAEALALKMRELLS